MKNRSIKNMYARRGLLMLLSFVGCFYDTTENSFKNNSDDDRQQVVRLEIDRRCSVNIFGRQFGAQN